MAHRDFEKGLNVHAYYKTHDHATSEDLVQDTFVKTWRYLVKGGKIDVMKSFLYHILNHLIIDQYRKHKTSSLDMILDKGFEPIAPNSNGFLNVLDGRRAIILIQQLPAKYQKVMRMKYVQDLSLKEMSLLTGESKNALSVQTHRGLEMLKLLYSPK